MAVTEAHNRVFPHARVSSRVIYRGNSLFSSQKAETYMFFYIRSTLTVVVCGSCVFPLIIIFNQTFFELPLSRRSEQNNTIPIQLVDSYL